VHWNNEQRLLLWRGNSDQELRERGMVAGGGQGLRGFSAARWSIRRA
jgi:hypothetical protein